MSPWELPCDVQAQVPVSGPGLGFLSLATARPARDAIAMATARDRKACFMFAPQKTRSWELPPLLGRRRLLAFPLAHRRAVARRVAVEQAVLQNRLENVEAVRRVEVDLQHAVFESRGGDFHAALRRRHGAGDLFAVLIELEREGRIALVAAMRLALPGAGQRSALRLLLGVERQARQSQGNQGDSRQRQGTLHVQDSFRCEVSRCLERSLASERGDSTPFPVLASSGQPRGWGRASAHFSAQLEPEVPGCIDQRMGQRRARQPLTGAKRVTVKETGDRGENGIPPIRHRRMMQVRRAEDDGSDQNAPQRAALDGQSLDQKVLQDAAEEQLLGYGDGEVDANKVAEELEEQSPAFGKDEAVCGARQPEG